MAYPSFVENGDSIIARISRPYLIPSPTFGYSSCDAPQAFLLLANDDRTRLDLVAHSGTRSGFVKVLQESPLPLDASVAESARSVLEQTVIHTRDLREDKLYQEGQHHRVRAVEVEGVRTRLLVPLISNFQLPLGALAQSYTRKLVMR